MVDAIGYTYGTTNNTAKGAMPMFPTPVAAPMLFPTPRPEGPVKNAVGNEEDLFSAIDTSSTNPYSAALLLGSPRNSIQGELRW